MTIERGKLLILPDQGMTIEPNPAFPLPPPNGWNPDDFPKLTTDLIPHSSFSGVRADPFMTITPEGWLYIEVGNVRLACPDQQEWEKLDYMARCMWNAYEVAQSTNEDPEGENDDSSIDTGVDGGQASDPGYPESESCGDPDAALPSDPQSG